MKNKDIMSLNEKGQQHGYWELYNPNGSVYYKCFYNNGNPVGYEEYYYWGNKLSHKTYHI